MSEKKCKHCNAVLVRKRFPSKLEDLGCFSRRVYCDRECMAADYYGTTKVPTPQNGRRQSARVVENNCEGCGRHHEETRLVVHHIDENPLNNDPKNLTTLCGSCHRRRHSPNSDPTTGLPKPCKHCSRASVRRGLCATHLTRFRKYGDPLLKKLKVGSSWVLKRLPE